MIVFDNHGTVDVSHKTTEQIVDLRFKEYEIRQKKEAEDRAEAAAKAALLAQNKADVTTKATEQPKAKVELATVPHPTAVGRAIAKLRNKLHL